MSEIAVKVQGVNKTFKLPHQKQNSVKGLFVNMFRRSKTFERQHVLKDISFEVKKGEFFGIVGRNGSGKSTLLKLLAGIYSPDKGHIELQGNLTPFIELGVGFNPELTGRDNVYLNGALLGFNRKEMDAMYQEIVDFAELEKFMDQKLKNYSSGMQVRLAFSVAIRAKSDILLIDEVLAVGDASFQQKCFDVFADLKKKGTTIVLVTHDMNSVLRFCDRTMLIHDSKLVAVGKPAEIADAYLELNYEAHETTDKESEHDPNAPSIRSVIAQDSRGKNSHVFGPGQDASIVINFDNAGRAACHFGLQIFNEAGVYCFGTNTKICGLEAVNTKAGSLKLDTVLNLTSGSFYVTAAIMNENATTVFTYKPRVAEFRIKKDSQVEGVALLDHNWEYADV